MRKFTEKSLLAMQTAQSLAREYGNQEITQAHLLCALVSDEGGLIGQLLTKMNKSASEIEGAVKAEIEKFPKVQGGEQYLSAS